MILSIIRRGIPREIINGQGKDDSLDGLDNPLLDVIKCSLVLFGLSLTRNLHMKSLL